jgi:hypothetical protein
MASDGHGGKIPGKVKDRLPVIPDKIVEKLDQGKDVSVEELVGTAALEAVDAQRRSHAAPVHAEDLVPVRKDDPRIAGATAFGTGSLPAVPSRRRVIPAPFARPRIAVDHHGKSWQRVRARDVSIGDLVVDLGQVTAWREEVRRVRRSEIVQDGARPDDPLVAVGTDILLENAEGAELRLDEGTELRVFARTGAGEPDARALRTF